MTTNIHRLPYHQSTMSPLTATVKLVQTGAVGGVAAAISQILHHPIYQLKNQMQVPGFSFRGFINQSLANPSKTLYGGITQRIIAVMPEKALKMQAWEITILMLTYARNSDVKKVSSWLLAGSAAGTIIQCDSDKHSSMGLNFKYLSNCSDFRTTFTNLTFLGP